MIVYKITRCFLTFMMAIFIATGAVNAQSLEGALEQAEGAQAPIDAGCSMYLDPEITVRRQSGSVYVNSALTEVALAREKSQILGSKMPERQGNMGVPELNHRIDLKQGAYATTGCVYLETLTVDIRLDHKTYIAGEYPPDSCEFDTFYELEAELSAMDEEVFTAEVASMERFLKSLPENIRFAGPDFESGIQKLRAYHKRNVVAQIDAYVASIRKKLIEQRLEYDDPAFYEEIIAECAGT